VVTSTSNGWPDYWARLFRSSGYDVFDLIRPRIWTDTSIPTWYRQNVLLFVKDSRLSSLPGLQGRQSSGPLALVHPEIYLKGHRKTSGIRNLVRSIRGK
jgi:hypothetical protein